MKNKAVVFLSVLLALILVSGCILPACADTAFCGDPRPAGYRTEDRRAPAPPPGPGRRNYGKDPRGSRTAVPFTDREPVDMVCPELGKTCYSRIYAGAYSDYDMNINIYWVQAQLQYQGYYCGDLTGLFDRETNRAVRCFLEANGYSYRNVISQEVVDNICRIIGEDRVPVMYGGFYHYLDVLLNGEKQTGHMNIIWSNINHDRYGPDPNTPYVHPESGWVQYALDRLGFNPNGVDQKFGEGTDGAVQRFEAAAGFRVKERRRIYVTYGEARAMLEMCYYGGIALEPLTGFFR